MAMSASSGGRKKEYEMSDLQKKEASKADDDLDDL